MEAVRPRRVVVYASVPQAHLGVRYWLSVVSVSEEGVYIFFVVVSYSASCILNVFTSSYSNYKTTMTAVYI